MCSSYADLDREASRPQGSSVTPPWWNYPRSLHQLGGWSRLASGPFRFDGESSYTSALAGSSDHEGPRAVFIGPMKMPCRARSSCPMGRPCGTRGRSGSADSGLRGRHLLEELDVAPRDVVDLVGLRGLPRAGPQCDPQAPVVEEARDLRLPLLEGVGEEEVPSCLAEVLVCGKRVAN